MFVAIISALDSQ